MGIEISSPNPKENLYIKGSIKKRASTVRLRLEALQEKLLQKFEENGFFERKNSK